VVLHQDNAPAHTSRTTQLELDLLGFECLKHPPYSPDLAPNLIDNIKLNPSDEHIFEMFIILV
jgi:hypothetical protein